MVDSFSLLFAELIWFHRKITDSVRAREHLFEENAVAVAENLLRDLARVHADMRLIAHSKLDGIPSEELASNVATCATALRRIHRRLARVPTPFPSRELTTFVKKTATALGSNHRVAVTLSPEYNFLKDDIGAAIKGPGETALVNIHMGVCDHADPFYWPFLAHELAHVVYNTNTELQYEAEVAGIDRGVAANWIEELVCDTIATRMFGPSYLAAFVFHAALHCLSHTASETHPSPYLRVALITKALTHAAIQGSPFTQLQTLFGYSFDTDSTVHTEPVPLICYLRLSITYRSEIADVGMACQAAGSGGLLYA